MGCQRDSRIPSTWPHKNIQPSSARIILFLRCSRLMPSRCSDGDEALMVVENRFLRDCLKEWWKLHSTLIRLDAWCKWQQTQSSGDGSISYNGWALGHIKIELRLNAKGQEILYGNGNEQHLPSHSSQPPNLHSSSRLTRRRLPHNPSSSSLPCHSCRPFGCVDDKCSALFMTGHLVCFRGLQ